MAFGGRLLTPQDDRPSAPPAAVLSHQTWQTEYGADPSVVGSTFVINGHPFTIIGVAPPGFFGDTLRSDPPNIWIPVQQEPLIDGESAILHQSIGAWLRVIGRLRPGASIDGMAPRLTGILRQWLQHDSGYPANWLADIVQMLPKQTINVVPAGAGVAAMKEEYGRSLQILLAVCGMVLLIACANVANLLLARAVARRTQTALRLAVGASRRQIVGQALLESVMLAIAGGMAGLVVAVAAARLLLVLAFRSSHFLPIDPMPSPVVLAFAFAVALLTGSCLWRRSGLVRHPDRSCGSLARIGPQHHRPLRVRSQSAAHRTGRFIGGLSGRRNHAGAKPQQAGAPELRIPDGRAH